MNSLNIFGIEELLPFFRFYIPPNPIKQTWFHLFIVEVFVNVGKNLRYLIQQINHFLFGVLYNFLQQLFINNPIWKFQVIYDNSDYLRIILQVKQHISDLINNEPLYLCILKKVVMLNINLERFALKAWILWVNYRGHPLDYIDLSIQLEFSHQEMRSNKILKILLVTVGPFYFLSVYLQAPFFNL